MTVASTCFISYSYIDANTFPKWIVFAYGTCLMLIFSSIISIISIKEKRHLKSTNLNYYSATLIGLLIFTYLYIHSQTQEDFKVFLCFCLFSLTCFYFKNYIPTLNLVAFSLIICGFVSSVFAIIQILKKEEITGCYDNVVGFTLTIVLASLSIIHILKSKYGKNPVSRTIFKVLLIIFLILLLASKSRTGLLSLCVGSCILINKGFPFIHKRINVIISCVVVLIVSISVFNITKKDSTHGRWFILNTSLSLLDSPTKIVFGYGEDGFKENYMMRQAQRLMEESVETQQRASNIIHPLNEFLLLTIKYGIISFIISIFALLYFFKSKYYNLYSKALVISIIVFSLFSYPFKYPITWIIIAMAATSYDKHKITIAKNNRLFQILERIKIYGSSLILLFSCFALLYLALDLDTNMRKWRLAYENTILGNKVLSLKMYKEISQKVQSPEFTYNYASYLYNIGEYADADALLKKVTLRDYETTILLGRIKDAICSDSEAIEQFKLAHDMCPNRFIPLFEIYKIHKRNNNKPMQKRYATLLLSKSIKIPSTQIDEILKTIKNDQINNYE